MKTQRQLYTPVLRGKMSALHNMRFGLLVATAMGVLAAGTATPAYSQNYNIGQAAAKCRSFTNSVQNLRQLSDRRNVLIAIKTCIDLGIDPPLKARNSYGRAPASGIATSQIPGQTCPPFATCLFSARVNQAAENPLTYNTAGGYAGSTGRGGSGGGGGGLGDGGGTGGSGGGGGGDNGSGIDYGDLGAPPQFTGHLPAEIPAHLENGATIYFYGDNIDIRPPEDSLVYSDGTSNFYADGGREQISDGHVMVPPAPNGNIMQQEPVIMRQRAMFNFDDGGVMVLPDGFVGVINGQTVRGGQRIVINHADDIIAPAGTKLYPFPMGYDNNGVHADEPGHTPYSGPPVNAPNGAISLNNPNYPGTEIWWENP